MTITFDTIPSNLRNPGFFIEFDNSGAGVFSSQYKALLIGAKASAGSATADTVYALSSADAAVGLFGQDSELHKMATAFKANNNNVELSAIATADTNKAFTAIGDERYHYFISALASAAEIGKMNTKLEARYKGLSQNGGIAFYAHKDTHAKLKTFGAALNSPFVSVLGYLESSQSAPEWAAAYGGKVAESLSNDAARPLQTLKLVGLQSASSGALTQSQRGELLYDGISTFIRTVDGSVSIGRAITTYQSNAAGVADASYLDVTTPATLMFLRDFQRSRLSSLYPRHKLAKDGTLFPAGQAIITPSLMRSSLVAIYEELIERGLVEDVDGYKSDLLVEINAGNATRIDVRDNPRLVNGLITYAMRSQFSL